VNVEVAGVKPKRRVAPHKDVIRVVVTVDEASFVGQGKQLCYSFDDR
jgi:hypothetical protein